MNQPKSEEHAEGWVSHVVLETLAAVDGLENQLLPEERALIENSTDSNRRKLFTAGRISAHKAVQRALPSSPINPIIRDSSGQPIFIQGVRGSISHCDGFAVAAASSTPYFLGLGIDVEHRKRPITSAVRERITSQAEKDCYGSLLETENDLAIKIFCAKEALFKACFPFIGRAFSFKDVSILISSPQEPIVRPAEKLSNHLTQELKTNWRLALNYQEIKGRVIAVAALLKTL